MSRKIWSSASVLFLCCCLVLTAVIQIRNTETTVNSEIELKVIAAEPETIETKVMLDEKAQIMELSAEEIAAMNRWKISLTTEEMEALAGILWLEANGEPEEGQQAIVEVVFNRMISENFPDDLYEVIAQKSPVQFCSYSSLGAARPTEKEYDSIYSVLLGKTEVLQNNTCYFATSMLTDNLDILIGHHYFCY